MTRARRAGLCAIVLAAASACTGTAAAQPPAVNWLILADDLHFDFRNTGRVRWLVRTVARELPIDGDMVALSSCGPSRVAVKPTLDRALIDSELRKLTGSALRPEDTLGAPNDAEVRHRAGMTQTCVGNFIAGAGEARDRPTALIYISNGYAGGTPPDLGGSQIPVFVIDSRLLEGALNPVPLDQPEYWAATRQSLRLLAEQSGGVMRGENQPLPEFLTEITQRMRRR